MNLVLLSAFYYFWSVNSDVDDVNARLETSELNHLGYFEAEESIQRLLSHLFLNISHSYVMAISDTCATS